MKLPIGISDFKELIEDGYAYADKSLFIEEVVLKDAKSMLIPRPRRFGKTLNMSMLHCFFDVEEATSRSTLFKGLDIEKSEVWKMQGQHPVIFLTFKDVKESSFAAMLQNIAGLCLEAFEKHRSHLLQSKKLEAHEMAYVSQVDATYFDEVNLGAFLKQYSKLLAKHFGQKVVILIDEYDASIIKAWEEGFLGEMLNFMRNFLSGGLKDNPHLFKGVVTGILRVAKENIFSGLNNMQVYGVLNHAFADKFGLTTADVARLVADRGGEGMEDVKRWYNGYRFGHSTEIYNPWSVLCYLANREDGLLPYWVNSSANALVQSILKESDAATKSVMLGLLEGKEVEAEIEEQIIFADLESGKSDTVLGLLLYSGYLTARKIPEQGGATSSMLSLPNLELKSAFEKLMGELLGLSQQASSNDLLSSFLNQDIEEFQAVLSDYLMTAFSFHDTRNDMPESAYHAFMLGLMAHLKKDFHVYSNRESGLGRADLLVYPKAAGDKRGWVMEFKKKRGGATLDVHAEEAYQQIVERGYIQEVKAQGKTSIMVMGIAFDGKQVGAKMELVEG